MALTRAYNGGHWSLINNPLVQNAQLMDLWNFLGKAEKDGVVKHSDILFGDTGPSALDVAASRLTPSQRQAFSGPSPAPGGSGLPEPNKERQQAPIPVPPDTSFGLMAGPGGKENMSQYAQVGPLLNTLLGMQRMNENIYQQGPAAEAYSNPTIAQLMEYI